MSFPAIEPRIAIAFSGTAVAVFLPAWSAMHHPGQSFELGLAIAGIFAAIGIFFGTANIDITPWDSWVAIFYGIWLVFGGVSCAALVFGLVMTANHWWQAAFVLVIFLQLAAMLLPVVLARRSKNI